jgi:hypothetical protein
MRRGHFCGSIVDMKKVLLPLLIMTALNGCVATAVSTAVDVGVEVIKVPFKVGGAIYDGVTGDDDEETDSEKQQED